MPEVSQAVYTAALAAVARDAALALVLDATASRGLAELELPDDGNLLLVVGPEGGISAGELDLLTGAGAIPVRLGPTVLRTSTAAAVAIGALGALTGRWN